MSDASRKRARLARLEELAALKATAERARLGRAVRDEARIARDVSDLSARRTSAAESIGSQAAPEMTMIAATGAWLRASEAEIRRLNVQLAALRARSATVRAEATRAIARHAVCEALLERAKRKARQRLWNG